MLKARWLAPDLMTALLAFVGVNRAVLQHAWERTLAWTRALVSRGMVIGATATIFPIRSGTRAVAAASQAPPAPVLSSPADGATITGTSVTLVWNSASGAGAYSVGLRDLNTNTLANISLVTATSTTQS